MYLICEIAVKMCSWKLHVEPTHWKATGSILLLIFCRTTSRKCKKQAETTSTGHVTTKDI